MFTLGHPSRPSVRSMAILVLGVSAAAGPVSASALQTRIVESAVTLSQGGLAEFRFQLEDASEHWIRFSEGHIESTNRSSRHSRRSLVGCGMAVAAAGPSKSAER